jgi:hypothetical protein
VTANLRLDPGRKRPPANHPPHIGLEQGIAGHLARSTPWGAKERPLAGLGDAGRLDVLHEVAVQIVVRLASHAPCRPSHAAGPTLDWKANEEAAKGRGNELAKAVAEVQSKQQDKSVDSGSLTADQKETSKLRFWKSLKVHRLLVAG